MKKAFYLFAAIMLLLASCNTDTLPEPVAQPDPTEEPTDDTTPVLLWQYHTELITQSDTTDATGIFHYNPATRVVDFSLSDGHVGQDFQMEIDQLVYQHVDGTQVYYAGANNVYFQ